MSPYLEEEEALKQALFVLARRHLPEVKEILGEGSSQWEGKRDTNQVSPFK
jgi:hypothetical protein